jgi:hypothetical protein
VTLESGRWRTRRDLPVLIALAVLLTAGWTLKGSVEGRMTTFTAPAGSLRIRYPAGWRAVPGSTALLEVQDPLSGGAVPASLIVTREARPAGQTLDQLGRAGSLRDLKQLDLYRVLSVAPITVAGKPAQAVTYAYVSDPHAGTLELQRIPVVVRGTQIVLPVGDAVYRIDFRADTSVFDSERPTLDRVIQDIQP